MKHRLARVPETMTHKLYLNSSDLHGQAEVVECREAGPGRYAVRLSQTLFHPQGGGQPSDTGFIAGVPVLHVTQDANGLIQHWVGAAIEPGRAVLNVDACRRERHARLHTAGHLIGHILAHAGWQPVKAHHWPGECKVVFTGQGEDELPHPDWLQGACAAAIFRNLPIQAVTHETGRRLVQIQGMGAYPCAGTHVGATGELDGLRITDVQFKKGQLSIRYDFDPLPA